MCFVSVRRMKQKADVFSIAIGASINPNVMRSLSSKPESDYYYRVFPGQPVTDAVNDVINKICNAV